MLSSVAQPIRYEKRIPIAGFPMWNGNSELRGHSRLGFDRSGYNTLASGFDESVQDPLLADMKSSSLPGGRGIPSRHSVAYWCIPNEVGVEIGVDGCIVWPRLSAVFESAQPRRQLTFRIFLVLEHTLGSTKCNNILSDKLRKKYLGRQAADLGVDLVCG